jgi:translation initiation factor IF-2
VLVRGQGFRVALQAASAAPSGQPAGARMLRPPARRTLRARAREMQLAPAAVRACLRRAEQGCALAAASLGCGAMGGGHRRRRRESAPTSSPPAPQPRLPEPRPAQPGRQRPGGVAGVRTRRQQRPAGRTARQPGHAAAQPRPGKPGAARPGQPRPGSAAAIGNRAAANLQARLLESQPERR